MIFSKQFECFVYLRYIIKQLDKLVSIYLSIFIAHYRVYSRPLSYQKIKNQVDIIMALGWMTREVGREKSCALLGTNIMAIGRITSVMVEEFLTTLQVSLK